MASSRVGSQIAVRPARQEDMDSVFNIILESYQVERGATGVSFHAGNRYDSRAFFESDVKQSLVLLVAVDPQASILGVVRVVSDGPEAVSFGPLAVSIKSQRKGVGKALIQQVFVEAERYNKKYVRCCLINWRTDLLSYYSTLGFNVWDICEFSSPFLTRPSHKVCLQRLTQDGLLTARGEEDPGEDNDPLAEHSHRISEAVVLTIGDRLALVHQQIGWMVRVAFLGVDDSLALHVCRYCEEAGITIEACCLIEDKSRVVEASQTSLELQASTTYRLRSPPAYLHAAPSAVDLLEGLDVIIVGPEYSQQSGNEADGHPYKQKGSTSNDFQSMDKVQFPHKRVLLIVPQKEAMNVISGTGDHWSRGLLGDQAEPIFSKHFSELSSVLAEFVIPS